jgi:hypothetical protein
LVEPEGCARQSAFFALSVIFGEAATVSDTSHSSSYPPADTHVKHDTHVEHDIWQHMTPAMQDELKADDANAWQQVVGVLLLIISIGLVLAVATALLSGVVG